MPFAGRTKSRTVELTWLVLIRSRSGVAGPVLLPVGDDLQVVESEADPSNPCPVIVSR